MARLHTAGAETASALTEGMAVAPAIATDQVRSGARSFKVVNAGTAGSFTVAMTSGTTYYFRSAVRFNALPASGVVNLLYTANIGALALNSSGQVELRRTSGGTIVATSSALSLNTWHVLELAVRVGSGAVDYVGARINSVLLGEANNVSITDTLGSPAFSIGGATATAGMDVWHDDVAINDSTGTDQNSWPGNGQIAILLPVSDNAIGSWRTGNNALLNLWDALDNRPPIGVAAANETATSNIENSSSAVLTPHYDGNMTTYTAAGLTVNHTVRVVQAVTVHGAEGANKTGSTAILSNPASAVATFGTAPAHGIYPTNWYVTRTVPLYNPSVALGTAPVARVTKTDTAAASVLCAAFLGILVEYVNQPPTVDAGADASSAVGAAFSRTATATDPEGQAITYAWTIVSAPGGSTATLSGASTATVTITPDVVGAYTLRATVTDAGGAAGSDDMVLTATGVAPTAPVLSGSTIPNAIDLSWTASSGATQYDLYRGVGGASPTLYQANLTVTTYQDNGLTNGTSYAYYVVAKNEYGSSPNSNTVTLTPQAGRTPRERAVRSTQTSPNAGTVRDLDGYGSAGTPNTVTGASFGIGRASTRYVPNHASGTGVSNTLPAQGTAPSGEGWRDAIAENANESVRYEAGTWTMRFRLKKTGQAVQIGENFFITWILYRVTAAGGVPTGAPNNGEIGRVSSASTAIALDPITVTTSFNTAASLTLGPGEKFHVEVYAQNTELGNVGDPTAEWTLTMHLDQSAANDATAISVIPRYTILASRNVTAVGVGTFVVDRRLTLFRPIVLTAVPQMSLIRHVPKSITASGFGQMTLVNRVGKLMTFDAFGSMSLSSKLTKTVAISTHGAAAVDRRLTLFRALSVSGIGLMFQSRGVKKSIATNGIGAADLIRRLVLARSVTIVGIGAISIAKKATKAISTVGVGLAAVTRRLVVLRTVAASGIGAADLTRRLIIARGISVVGVGAVFVTNKIAKIVSIAGVGAAVLDRRLTLFRSVTSPGIGAMSLLRGTKKSVLTIGIGAADVARRLVLARSISVSAIGADFLLREIKKSISTVGFGAAFVIKKVTRTISAISVGMTSMDRRLTLLRFVAVPGIGAMSLARGIKKIVTATGIGAVEITRRLVIARAVEIVGVGAVAITKKVTKVISVVGVAAAAVERRVIVSRSIVATAIGAAIMSRAMIIRRSVEAVGIGMASLARRLVIARSVDPSSVGAVIVDRRSMLFRALTAATEGAAEATRRAMVFRAIAASAIGEAVLARALVVRRTVEAITRGAVKIAAKLPIEGIPGSSDPDFPVNTPTRQIAGVVRSSTGALVPGATVKLFRQSDDKRVGQTISADVTAEYSFIRDEADPYTYYVLSYIDSTPQTHGVSDRDNAPEPI